MHSETDIPIARRSCRECVAYIYITSSATRSVHAYMAFKKLWDNWCAHVIENYVRKDVAAPQRRS